MTENKEIIAKALEIAITLTDAKETWLFMDENRNVLMKEPLLSTLEKVIQIIKAKNLDNICKDNGTFVYPMKQ